MQKCCQIKVPNCGGVIHIQHLEKLKVKNLEIFVNSRIYKELFSVGTLFCNNNGNKKETVVRHFTEEAFVGYYTKETVLRCYTEKGDAIAVLGRLSF